MNGVIWIVYIGKIEIEIGCVIDNENVWSGGLLISNWINMVKYFVIFVFCKMLDLCNDFLKFLKLFVYKGI